MKCLLEKMLQIKESSIDFAQEDLDSAVWVKDRYGEYTIQPGAERRIFDVLSSYTDQDLKAVAAKIRVIGSITTNQYVEETDIDVHVIPKDPEQWSEEEVKKVKKWFDTNRDKIGGFIESHPIEVYIQTNENQDLLSDGVYDLLLHRWEKGPKLMPLDYDPYEDFSDIADDLRDTVEDADKLLGELSRDVIDYDVIQSAMGRMSPDQKQHFLARLESKLQEIEDDIQSLYRVRGDLVRTRRTTSAPTSPEQALHDVELAKKWKDANALFKFVGRYNYLKTISDLKKLLADDGEISPEDIDAIKQVIGVRNVSQTGE